MYFSFKNKIITGMVLIVPENERSFVDDMKLFNADEKRSVRLAKVMGYDKHRIAPDNVTASDMVEYGFNKLFESGDLKKEEIDALVYMTASPDQFLPPTSRILHGKLGLKKETYCIDITQGCSAFEEFKAFFVSNDELPDYVDDYGNDKAEHWRIIRDRYRTQEYMGYDSASGMCCDLETCEYETSDGTIVAVSCYKEE